MDHHFSLLIPKNIRNPILHSFSNLGRFLTTCVSRHTPRKERLQHGQTLQQPTAGSLHALSASWLWRSRHVGWLAAAVPSRMPGQHLAPLPLRQAQCYSSGNRAPPRAPAPSKQRGNAEPLPMVSGGTNSVHKQLRSRPTPAAPSLRLSTPGCGNSLCGAEAPHRLTRASQDPTGHSSSTTMHQKSWPKSQFTQKSNLSFKHKIQSLFMKTHWVPCNAFPVTSPSTTWL